MGYTLEKPQGNQYECVGEVQQNMPAPPVFCITEVTPRLLLPTIQHRLLEQVHTLVHDAVGVMGWHGLVGASAVR